MAKFHGKVGYASFEETTPGVYEEKITEKNYYGEVIKNTRNLQSANQVNDNINVAFEISIVSDPYANQNFHAIRYVIYLGTKWKVSSVSVQYPRLILSIGGVYNE